MCDEGYCTQRARTNRIIRAGGMYPSESDLALVLQLRAAHLHNVLVARQPRQTAEPQGGIHIHASNQIARRGPHHQRALHCEAERADAHREPVKNSARASEALAPLVRYSERHGKRERQTDRARVVRGGTSNNKGCVLRRWLIKHQSLGEARFRTRSVGYASQKCAFTLGKVNWIQLINNSGLIAC